MTNDCFATALVLAAIPTGIASGALGVWLFRWLFSALVAA